MRPIHAVLLLGLLAAALVGALLLVRADTRTGGIAAPLAETSEIGTSARDVPELEQVGGDAAGATKAGADRSEVRTGGEARIQSGPVGLRGRVVDPEGRPVAGAVVFAASSDFPFGLALDDVASSSPFLERTETTTGADGRFTLEPQTQSAVRIAVRADGFAPYNAQKPVAGSSLDVGDLRLERGAVLLGRVIDANGAPVAGARLHGGATSPGAGILALPLAHGPLLATTDAGGGFRVDRLAVGPWSVVVTSEEQPDKTVTGETERAGQVVSNLVIQLEQGYDIEGRVLGLSADHVADLSVVAGERASGEGLFEMLGPQRRAAIEPSGAFRVRGCKHDTEYRLSVRMAAKGFPSGTRSDVVTAKSGDHNVVLTYRAETALAFRVVDKLTGQPLEDLHVSAGYRWPLPLFEEGTGKPKRRFENGVVRYAPLAGGPATDPVTLRIECVGHAPYERGDLRLVAGVDNDLGVIALERSALVRITVLDAATGAPIQNATVALNELRENGREIGMTFSIDHDGGGEADIGGAGAAQRGKTRNDGRVEISSLPGKRATLSVRHKDHATWRSEPLDLPADGDFDVTVRMTAGGTVVVSVLDRDLKPVAGLTIDRQDSAPAAGMLVPGARSDNVTDGAGRVVFAHLPAGTQAFRVRPPGGSGLLGGFGGALLVADSEHNSRVAEGWHEATVVEGETITLRLEAPELGDLGGRVREGGKPLAGATVTLRPRTESPFDLDLDFLEAPLSAVTNATGDYALAGVPVAEYRVVVTHPSRAMKWEGAASIAEGSARFDVELPLATLEGRVTNEEGKPIEGARVSVERMKQAAEDGGSRSVEMNFVMITSEGGEGEAMTFGGPNAPTVKTDADGRYRLKGVHPDVALQVVVSGREYQTARSGKVEVGTDEVRSGVDVVVKQGGAIEVSARRSDGTTVSGAIVRAEPVEGESQPKTGFTGPDGRTTLSGLAPGRWRVTCTRTAFEEGARDARGTPREVVVRGGETERLTIDLPQ